MRNLHGNKMALIARLKQASVESTPVDIANNLRSLQFESALSPEEMQLIHLRNRTHAITVSSCAQATFFASVLHEARQLKKQLKSPQKRTAKILQDREPRDPLKVGIIGCGRLGSQLAHCLLTYGDMNPKDLNISTRRPETLEYLRNKGVDCNHDNVRLASTCHLIFLCVLPSHVQTVAEEICDHIPKASFVFSLITTYTPKRLKQLLGTSNVLKPEYTWSADSDQNSWNCNVNVNTALENAEIVEKTCPIGFTRSECVVVTEEKLAEIMIFAFLNLATSLRLNKEDALTILHVVMFEDTPEDRLHEEDFIRKSKEQAGMFPRFQLTQLTEVTTSVLRRITTSHPLKTAFVKKYLGLFENYVQQKAYDHLSGNI